MIKIGTTFADKALSKAKSDEDKKAIAAGLFQRSLFALAEVCNKEELHSTISNYLNDTLNYFVLIDPEEGEILCIRFSEEEILEAFEFLGDTSYEVEVYDRHGSYCGYFDRQVDEDDNIHFVYIEDVDSALVVSLEDKIAGRVFKDEKGNEFQIAG